MSEANDPAVQETCPWLMSDGEPCGRLIHPRSQGVDLEPVCLMHSTDLNKDSAQFQQEIRAILDGTSKYNRRKDIHDFTGFVFLAVDFSGAEFTQNADFIGAEFTQNADFSGARFTQNADFREARFTHDANFFLARFTQNADFSGTRFMKPAEVRFFQANEDCPDGLRVRFVNCKIEGADFTDVHWHKQGGRIVLEDEIGVLKGESQEYELVAEAYRQLVNNFEKARAYDLAEDCFIGAMEMKRLNPRNHLLGPLGRWLSVVYLYRFLSKYGSSYARALSVLVVFLLLFAVLFPAFGLRMSPESKSQAACPTAVPGTPEAAVVSWRCALAHPNRAHELCGTLKAGLLASMETATFQRTPYLVPATTRAKVVGIFETVVIPGQLALFLLALRRRFRR